MKIKQKRIVSMNRFFDSNLSDLAKDPNLVYKYAQLLEREIGHGFRVDGIIEIGSYAKDEAVPGSDIDTRIYVSAPDYYLWQTSGSRFSTLKENVAKIHFDEFIGENGVKPIHTLDWFEFNESVAKKINTELKLNIEFGLTDSRYANFEINNLDKKPSSEHQLLLESQIVFDPKGLINAMLNKITGETYPQQVKFYQKRYLDQPPFEIYTHLKAHEMDKQKLEKSRQIQWVKWAVRAIRDAVGSKSYMHTGRLLFKKGDILIFCSKFLAEDFDFIREIYLLKTDQKVREDMISSFLNNADPWFGKFQEYTKKIELIVQKINKLSFSDLM